MRLVRGKARVLKQRFLHPLMNALDDVQDLHGHVVLVANELDQVAGAKRRDLHARQSRLCLGQRGTRLVKLGLGQRHAVINRSVHGRKLIGGAPHASRQGVAS